jgi:NitT/TauT family transport system ATP-binding protein
MKAQEPPATSLVSLPEIGISQILGLVELLIGKGGREDIYKLAGELSMELGETLTVIKVREKLENLSAFKAIREFLASKDDAEVGRDEVLEKLAELIPNDDAETSFSTLVNWGRYAEMFGYNDDTQTFYLDDDEE